MKELLSKAKNLGLVQFGVIFEKMIPLVVSFIFIAEIEVEVYGKFVVYYQAIIITIGAISASIIQDFNNNYLKSSDYIEINDPYTSVTIGIVILFTGWLYNVLETDYLLRIATISIIAPVNLVIFNFQRFKRKEHLYFIYTFIRLGVFILSLLLYLDKMLNLIELLNSILFLNLLPVLFYFNRIKIKWNSIRFMKENFLVSIYGLSTLFLFGAEKIFMEMANYSLEEIAIFSYSLTIINSSAIMIEGVKKQIGPSIYFDLQNDGFYSNSLLSKIKYYFLFLSCFIALAPLILITLLKLLNLYQTNLSLDNYSLAILVINQIIFSTYHFLNPYVFFWKKTIVLIVIQLISIILFFLAINLVPKDLLNITFIKLGTTIVLITSVVLYIKRNHGRIL